jgi:hypothetical protein
MDQVHVSVDRPGVLGSLWTDGSADRRGVGARRRAHRSSGSAVEARRRWCRIGRRRRSVRTLLRHGERGKEVGEGVVLLGGGARLL